MRWRSRRSGTCAQGPCPLPRRVREAGRRWRSWGGEVAMASVAPRYCSTSCATQADCRATKVSSDIWPVAIMSNACSQTAVRPGSATAAGTASISIRAVSDGRTERPLPQQIAAIEQALDDGGAGRLGTNAGAVLERLPQARIAEAPGDSLHGRHQL